MNERTNMSISNLNYERREPKERRIANGGPPAGMSERRINIERRLFNLGVDSGKEWLSKPPPDVAGRTTPFPNLYAFIDSKAG
jgi:hypothetical protein